MLSYALLGVALALLAWWGLRSRTARRDAESTPDRLDTIDAWPPQATRVLTPAERHAYDLTRRALPGHMVLAQVPLQRFIRVPTRNSYTEWLRRAGHLSVDVLVCDRHSDVIAAIEVLSADDPPNERAQRRRDRLFRVLKAARIPTYTWISNAWPTPQAVRDAIAPPAAPPDIEPIEATPPSSRAAEPVVDVPFEEVIEMREPPPSTWFGDSETLPPPLEDEAAKRSKAQRR